MVLCHMVLKVPVARGNPEVLAETMTDPAYIAPSPLKNRGGVYAFYVIKCPTKRRPLSITSEAPSLHPSVPHKMSTDCFRSGDFSYASKTMVRGGN